MCVRTLKHVRRIVRVLPVRLLLSVSECRVALRWQLARLIPVREGRGPAPRRRPDLPGLTEVHSARPLSVSRRLSLRPVIARVTDRRGRAFDGARGF